ncbi:AI-2E family transporter [bacterium]|nr:MAG: AI-2E family transporter [bacterium]
MSQLETATAPATSEIVTLKKSAFTPRDWIRGGFFAAVGVALLGVGILIAWKLGTAILAIVTPFVIALILALLLDPLVDRLQRRGLSRAIGVTLIFGSLLLLLIGIGIIVIPALIAQASQLSHDGPSYVEKGQAFANEFLASHRTIGTIQLPENVQELFSQFSARASQFVQGSAGRVAGLLLVSFTMIIETFVTLIATFYLLMDIDRLRARLYYFAPERARGPIAQYAGDIGAVFSNYLRGLMIVCALYGASTIIIFYSLGFVHAEMRRYALLLGVAAGLLFAVPYVGTIATAVVAGVVALVAGGPQFGAVAVVIIIILNQVYDHIITPRVIGGGVGLHPVITVFALVLGGELFGLAGLLLSVPLAASLQVILFRLFPKLNSPTPESFLQEHGASTPPTKPALEEA